MDPSESNELLFFGNHSSTDFDTNVLLSEPIADERDMTTRSQDTFDSFGDFAQDIDIDLSDDDLSLHHQSVSDHLSGFAVEQSSSPALSPTIPKPATSTSTAAAANPLPMANSFLSSSSSSSITQQASATNNSNNRMRQIPARAASYSEGDQHSLLLQIQQQQSALQQQQQLMLQNSLSSLQNASFHDTATSTSTTTTTREQSLFSQHPNMQGLPSSASSQHSLTLPQRIPGTQQTPANLNDAMEKLCETMKRSAVTRNLVKQLGVTRSNSGVGLMRTNSGVALKRTSSAKGSIGDMARMAPIRRPSHNSKHSIKRGVLPQSSQHSLDGSNHLLQVDGRSIAHF